ncbi:hypothetical protein F5051DRAFT_304761, partial [Lentinula edodes]
EEARWLGERTRLESFCKAWGAEVTARSNYHEVVVEFIPVSLDLEDEWMRRMIESTNNLQQGSIAMARWIKKPELRRSGQQVAHAIFAMRSRSEANRIGEGILIAGKYLEVRKNLSDPVRCMKCQHYGHIAKECEAVVDTCGRCGGHHPTRDCIAPKDKLFCALCRGPGHGAASRSCAVLQRKLRERCERDSERIYRFFVTEEPETWVRTDKPL